MQTGAIDAVLKNYPALLKALQNIAETCYDDYGWKANGLNAQLEKFDTYFGLKLSYLIFSGTEQTSITLQGKNTSVQEALSCAEVMQGYLSRLRSDETFIEFYASVVKEAEQYTDAVLLLHLFSLVVAYTKVRQDHLCTALLLHLFSLVVAYTEVRQDHLFKSPEDYYRSLYFEALDLVSKQISIRFGQESMSIPKELENY